MAKRIIFKILKKQFYRYFSFDLNREAIKGD